MLVSSDDTQYHQQCMGKSWPGWQTVTLDKYMAGPQGGSARVYVKIQGTDCQVREVVLY